MSAQLTHAHVEQLFSIINETNPSSKNYEVLFNSIIQNIQVKENEKLIIAYINKLLKTSVNRERGYEYLNMVLFCCSSEVLVDNSSDWLSHAIAQNQKQSAARLKFLANILPLCHGYQDVRKVVVSTYLVKIMDLCVSYHITSPHTENILHTLVSCLQNYPTSCGGMMKAKIETYLLKFLQFKDSEYLVKQAAKCFHYLQQVGGGGQEGFNYVDNWATCVLRLCCTLHNVYDLFFENVQELEIHTAITYEPYDLPPLPSETGTLGASVAYANYLNNVCIFLRTAIEKKFPVVKVIRPQIILNMFKRCLTIHTCIVDSSDINSAQFSSLLIKHQVDVLYILRSLIACLHVNLIPFSTTVTKLLLDCLPRTRNCMCFNNDSTYKVTVYEVLIYWIKIMKNNLSTGVHDKLMSEITEDIAPIKTEISLNMTSVDLPNNSSTAKKKAIKKRILASVTKHSAMRNHCKTFLGVKNKVCCIALECLACIFQYIHFKVKHNTLARIYSIIVENIGEIQKGHKVLPYCDKRSEIKLYETLLAMIDNPSLIIPPPLQITIKIFNHGLSSSNYYVSQMCHLGLSILEKVCQPLFPSLNFEKLVTQVGDNGDDESNMSTTEMLSQNTEKNVRQEESEEKNLVTNTVEKSVLSPEIVVETPIEVNVLSETATTPDDVVSQDDAQNGQLSQSDQNSDCLHLAIKKDKSSDASHASDSEAPPTKKIKIGSAKNTLNKDEESDDDMLNSFVDSINEY